MFDLGSSVGKLFAPLGGFLGGLLNGTFLSLTLVIVLFFGLFLIRYRFNPLKLTADKLREPYIRFKYYDLLRWFLVDFLERELHAGEFKEYGFTFFVGRQGAGKTISMVRYQYTDGTEAAPSVIQTVDAGNPYSVSSPAVSGYTPNQSTVTGEMPDEDLSITVTYQKNAIPRTLSVQYRYSDGSEAAPTVTRTLNPGEHYSIVSPNLAGYVPSAAVVTGNMPDASKTVVITYHPLISEHTLTIHYQYEDGGIAAADYTSVYLLNSPYSVPSPSVSGYRPDQSTVSGRMPDEDLSVSVIYRKVADGGDDSSSSGGDPVVPGDIFGGYQFQDPFSDTPDWGSIFGGHTFRDPFTEPFTGDIFGGYQFHDPFQMPN